MEKETLPDLPKVPTRIAWASVICIIVMALLALDSYCTENWFGFWVYITAIIIHIGVFVHRWMVFTRLHRQRRAIIAIDKIIRTPVIREEGNSIIFTFIMPKDHVLNALKGRQK